MEASTSRVSRPVALLAGGLVAAAWLALWAWAGSPYSRFLNHDALAGVTGAHAALLLVFVAGWVLMVAAMMLPTSLPLVLLFERMVSRRAERAGLVALLVAGYLAVWTLFGGLVHAGDWALHHAVASTPRLAGGAWLLGVAPLFLAGVYQFAPLKHRCLDRCRSPLSFIVEHWHGRRAWAEAFGLGLHHGLFCLGCCWALMLLMFAVGAGSLLWMLLLGAAMAVEKNVRWGKRLSAPLGILLLAWALGAAFGVAPALG